MTEYISDGMGLAITTAMWIIVGFLGASGMIALFVVIKILRKFGKIFGRKE